MDERPKRSGPNARSFPHPGRLQLAAFARAPQHRYIVRAIDPPAIDALPDFKLSSPAAPSRSKTNSR